MMIGGAGVLPTFGCGLPLKWEISDVHRGCSAINHTERKIDMMK